MRSELDLLLWFLLRQFLTPTYLQAQYLRSRVNVKVHSIMVPNTYHTPSAVSLVQHSEDTQSAHPAREIPASKKVRELRHPSD
jgi:hypothetical protein